MTLAQNLEKFSLPCKPKDTRSSASIIFNSKKVKNIFLSFMKSITMD